MKWPGGRLGRVAAMLAVLAVAVAAIGLDRVDHRPYFQAPYYTETVARLQAGATASNLTRGNWPPDSVECG